MPLYLLKNTTGFSQHNTVFAANTTICPKYCCLGQTLEKDGTIAWDNNMGQQNGTTVWNNDMDMNKIGRFLDASVISCNAKLQVSPLFINS